MSWTMFLMLSEVVVASPIDDSIASIGILETFGRTAYLTFSVIGFLLFNATTAPHCMAGGLSMLGVFVLPCAAFFEPVFLWCAGAFSF